MAQAITGKTALVIGGSAGIGKATTLALLERGARVTAVARGADRLRALATAHPQLATLTGDAADPAVAERLVRELRPDLVVIAAGVAPRMGPITDLDWDAFSAPWNHDVRGAFNVLTAALALPLAPGSTVVTVSSGAAIHGSPLSGGYAGAKRMQWLLAGYAQKLSDARGLGIRSIAVVPKQVLVGSDMGSAAATAYGAAMGLTAEQWFAKQFPAPLDAARVAAAIVGALAGEVTGGAIAVTGTGIEPL